MFINIIIAVALLGFLIFIHELGHFLAARKFGMAVEEFGIGFPPRLWGKKKGDTIYSINLIPLGGFVKIAGEDGESMDENKPEADAHGSKKGNRFSDKPIWQRVMVLSAGVLMNFLVGWLLLIPVMGLGSPHQIVVTEVAPDSPAAVAGFTEGDVLEGFESADDFVSFIDVHKGEPTTFEVYQDGDVKELTVTPRINPPEGEGSLGIGFVSGGLEAVPWYEAIWNALVRAGEMFLFIFILLFRLIASIFDGSHLYSQVSGPVGIYKATTQAAGLGWVYLANLMALISLNLAALNIFPFPALDGGRIVFLGIEKIRKKPVSAEVQQWVNGGAFILLLLLMVLVTIQDVTKFF
jgi:regulator of sigma E protease